jgi:hypothetical protein
MQSADLYSHSLWVLDLEAGLGTPRERQTAALELLLQPTLLIQSVAHIHQQYPDMCRDWIEKYLLDWIEMDYAPEHYSKAQLDELDGLTARWIADHFRRAKRTKRQRRTRHS